MLTCYFSKKSIVHLMIAQMIFPILVVDHCVIIIITCLGHVALFVIVPIEELREHLHVKHTNQSGENIKSTIVVKLSLGSAECCKDKGKIWLGM